MDRKSDTIESAELGDHRHFGAWNTPMQWIIHTGRLLAYSTILVVLLSLLPV